VSKLLISTDGKLSDLVACTISAEALANAALISEPDNVPDASCCDIADNLLPTSVVKELNNAVDCAVKLVCTALFKFETVRVDNALIDAVALLIAFVAPLSPDPITPDRLLTLRANFALFILAVIDSAVAATLEEAFTADDVAADAVIIEAGLVDNAISFVLFHIYLYQNVLIYTISWRYKWQLLQYQK